MSSWCKCRPETLEEACHQFVLPFCNGAGDEHAEQKGADAYSTLYALAEALKVDIIVQPVNDVASNVRVKCGQWTLAEWQTQVRLICKPGHFTVAWA